MTMSFVSDVAAAFIIVLMVRYALTAIPAMLVSVMPVSIGGVMDESRPV